MSALPPSDPAAPVLSYEHLQQLTAARLASRKIRRAIGVARGDGWTLAIFAALSFLFSLGSISGMAMGAGLGIIAWIELKGAARLKRLDPQAPRILAMNQVALSILLILYAAWHIVAEMTGHGEFAAMVAQEPQLGELSGSIQDLTRTIVTTLYGALIVIAIFAQGGLALYYFTRLKHLRHYLETTPAWITNMQKADISI